jgi:hypothetical protein
MMKKIPFMHLLKTSAVMAGFVAIMPGSSIPVNAQQTVDVEVTTEFIPIASVTVAAATQDDLSGASITSGPLEHMVNCYMGVSGSTPLPCSQVIPTQKTVIVTYL